MFEKFLRRIRGSPAAEEAPGMPEVDVPANLADVFTEARAVAAQGGPSAAATGERHVVIVTPGRLLRLQPCPAPGSMPADRVKAMQSMIAPQPQRHIAAIAYTELGALTADVSAAIPFLGMLLGLAYIGHAVWVFEGAASALPHGCRAADLLIVDGGMLRHLPADWYALAIAAMRRREIYVHDRATFKLQPYRPGGP